jgi:hypothetical protein
MQFIGIILFSFTSGTLTTIIANYDTESAKNRYKIDILNKILDQYHIPSELYA